jgi:hypothetical protein
MFRAQARRHADPIAPRLKIQGHQDSVDQTFKAQNSSGPERNTLPPAGLFQTWGIPCFDGENDDIPWEFWGSLFSDKAIYVHVVVR